MPSTEGRRRAPSPPDAQEIEAELRFLRLESRFFVKQIDGCPQANFDAQSAEIVLEEVAPVCRRERALRLLWIAAQEQTSSANDVAIENNRVVAGRADFTGGGLGDGSSRRGIQAHAWLRSCA